MRRFTVAVVLSLALGAVPTIALAQAKPPTTPPPATQKPPTPPPPAAQPPAAAPPPAAQPAPPPKPFPEGAKIAFINVPRIASESAEGKASSARVKALQERKLAELAVKNKQVETGQQRLSSGALLSDEARAATQKEIEKLNVEIQRMQQDAEAELQELQQQLQLDFQRRLFPIIQQIALEKSLHMLLSTEAGLVWAEPSLDLTPEIIKRFDATTAAVKAPVK
jgi:Skp family chaperone for outer membrane proteins